MKKTIIQEQIPNYITANSAAKTKIIDHIAAITGMNRKSVIRAIARERKRSLLKPQVRLGRPRLYTAETEAALAWVWEQYEYPCAERLHPDIAEAIRIFTRDNMWRYSLTATRQLQSMSLGAMKTRTVRFAKNRGLMRGISTTQGGAFKKLIPIFSGSWASKGPGHGQLDTVVHSGPKLMGSMVYSVNYVDVATYWQEPVAQLNKGERATLVSLKIIRKRLPYTLHELHPDSGSEFINQVAYDWSKEVGIRLTRSRPNKKNDNCYVEQRNRATIRKYIGYDRYDCQEAVDVMNELYKVLRLYINFFQATYKLVSKQKIVDENNSAVTKRTKRMYDQNRTPYQRVLDHPNIDQETKDALTVQYETLNPKKLRDRIQALTSKLEKVQRELGYHY